MPMRQQSTWPYASGDMQDYKREFIEFMVRCEVLRFGDFTTKSGRKTPYFLNTGRYRTGAQLARLARFYAQALRTELASDFDVLFGPAYKGIPLAVSTAMVLHEDFGHEVGFCFNRKEAKDHGEGGSLVGHPLAKDDRVVIIEDVTTAGTSIRETVPLLRAAAEIRLTALIVAVDRMERGTGHRSALDEIRETFGVRTVAIVTVDEIIEHLRRAPVDGKLVIDDALHQRILDYRAAYGAK
jgi:orotate phosphoribosyltransferase